MKNKNDTSENSVNVQNINENEDNNFGTTITIANTDNDEKMEYEMFVRYMENDMLQDVPFSMQNNIFIQKDIRKKIDKIYNLKKDSEFILTKSEDGYPYHIMLEYLKDGYFDKVKWIYPIVLDQRVIYSIENYSNEDNNNEMNIDNTISIGDVLENFSEQMKEIEKLREKLYEGTIKNTSFYSKYRNQVESFRQFPLSERNENIPSVKIQKLKDYAEMYRYFNIDTNNIKNRIGRGENIISLETPDKKETEETFFGTKNELIIESGEIIEIVGFLYLPNIDKYDKKEYIDKALKNKTIIKNNKIPQQQIEKESIVFFEKSKNNEINNNDYNKILKSLIPSSEQIINRFIENNNETNINNFNIELKKWGYSINTIDKQSKEMIKTSIDKNIKNMEIKELFQPSLDNKCVIKDKTVFVNDNYYNDVVIQKIYQGKLHNNSIEDGLCNEKRVNKIYNTNDHGDFYYSYFNEKNKISIDKKRIENIKKKIKPFDNTNNKELYTDLINQEKLNFGSLKDLFSKTMKTNIFEQNNNTIEIINNLLQKKENINDVQKKAYFLLSKNNEKNTIFNNQLVKSTSKIEKIKETKSDIDFLIKEINSYDTIYKKKEIIYSIIQNDGIYINRYIYSNLYKKPILCGHWYYLMLIDYSTTTFEKQKHMSELLSIFSVTEKDSSSENCSVCGGYLEKMEFVETYQAEKVLNIIEKKVSKYYYIHTQQTKSNFISEKVKDESSEEFINYINKKNIENPENNKRAILACKIINGISSKIDININPLHFIELVVTCTRESEKIIDYTHFENEKMKEYGLLKKYSNNQLLSDNSVFKKIRKSYSIHFMSKFRTLILAHLLWYLRTTIPVIKPGKHATTDCSFFGFNNEDGFNYILCVAEKSKLLTIRTKNGEEIVISKNKLLPHFRFWLNTLEKKYEYPLEIRREYEKNIIIYENINGSRKLNQQKEFFDWENEELKDVKNVSKGEVYIELFKNKIKIKKIKDDLIKKYYKNSNLLSNTGSHDFLEFLDEDYTFNDFFKTNENYIKINSNIGFLEEKIEEMKNKPPILLISNFNNTNESGNNNIVLNKDFETIKNIASIYCFEGKTKGETHSFHNIVDTRHCIKCGWSEKTEIKKDDYYKLYDYVQKKSLYIYQKKEIETKKINIISLKRDSTIEKINKNIDKFISLLIKNIDNTEKKEKINKIKLFLRNLDDFKDYVPEPGDIENKQKQTVLSMRERDKFTIQKLKEYINEYFRKNISRIKNGYRIKDYVIIDYIDKKNQEKWQKRIINNDEWVKPFLTDMNQKIFKKIQFNFSIENVNSIFGTQSIYDDSYKRFIKLSKFDLKDSIRLLKNYFIQEMSLFIELIGKDAPILCDFYIKMFEKISDDNKAIKLSKKEITKWEDTNMKRFILNNLKYKDFSTDNTDLINIKKLKENEIKPLFNDKIESKEELENELDNLKDLDYDEMLKNKMNESLGEEASQFEIEEYIQNEKEEKLYENETNQEIYNSQQYVDVDVDDVDYEYGDSEQILENEDDHVPDYDQYEDNEDIQVIDE